MELATATMVVLSLPGCSSSSGGRTAVPSGTASSPTASPTASQTADTTAADRAAAAARLRSSLAARAYEQRVLADRPLTLLPLSPSDVTVSLTATPQDGRLEGPAPTAVAGPVLRGQARTASHFAGQSYLSLAPRVGAGPAATWTLEFWLKRDGCDHSYRRVASTRQTVGTQPRTGIDVFTYPLQARSPCRVGAEIWQDGRFKVGCSQLVDGTAGWHHYAITRTKRSMSCWVDGVRVNRRRGVTDLPVGSDHWGVGDSGAGSDPATRLVGALADVALYDRALDAATISAHGRPRR